VPDPAYNFTEFFNRFDAIFVGRKTYETIAQAGGGPSGFPKFKEYVFSTTLHKVKEGATLVNADVKTEVEKIKKEKGKDIWLFGGAALTSSLLNLGLVDELSLGVYPVLLGGGKPLFSKIKNRVNLALLHTKAYPAGLVALTYALRQGPDGADSTAL